MRKRNQLINHPEIRLLEATKERAKNVATVEELEKITNFYKKL